MPTYIEYKNDDGSAILIELAEASGGVVRASNDGLRVVETGKKFSEAFASIRGTIKDLVAEMGALQIEEGEVKFGLKALAEAGVFAAPFEEAVGAPGELVRDQHGEQVDGRHGLGLRLPQTGFEHSGHAPEAELAQRALEFDEIHSGWCS